MHVTKAGYLSSTVLKHERHSQAMNAAMSIKRGAMLIELIIQSSAARRIACSCVAIKVGLKQHHRASKSDVNNFGSLAEFLGFELWPPSFNYLIEDDFKNFPVVRKPQRIASRNSSRNSFTVSLLDSRLVGVGNIKLSGSSLAAIISASGRR